MFGCIFGIVFTYFVELIYFGEFRGVNFCSVVVLVFFVECWCVVCDDIDVLFGKLMSL